MEKTIYSNSKINLGLNILGKLENGYHLLDMVMVPISLSDKMVINFLDKPGDLKITTNKSGIPTDQSNILYKIYEKFYNKSGIEKEAMEVYLEKIVPHEAGLGGGSSNGAFFLKELNSHHNNPLTLAEMLELGKSVGADIPFFIINKSSRVRGIGEVIDTLENNLDCSIIIIKPDFGVSTAAAYKNYSLLEKKKNADIENIIKGLKEGENSLVDKSIENILEQGLLLENENIKKFRKELEKIAGIKFHMSGSGSAYYSLIPKNKGQETYERVKQSFRSCEVFLCSFI